MVRSRPYFATASTVLESLRPRSEEAMTKAKEMVQRHWPVIERHLKTHRTGEMGLVVARMGEQDITDEEDALRWLIETTLLGHMPAHAMYLLHAAENRKVCVPAHLKKRTVEDLVMRDGDIRSILRAIHRFDVDVKLDAFQVSHLLRRSKVDNDVGLANEVLLAAVQYEWTIPLSWILSMVEWNSQVADAVMAKRIWDQLPQDAWHQGLESTLAKLIRALANQHRFADAYDILRPIPPYVYGKDQSSLLPAAVLTLAGKGGNRALGNKMIQTYKKRDSLFFHAILKYHVDMKDSRSIPSVLQRMKRAGIPLQKEHISMILKALLQSSLVDGYEYALMMENDLTGPSWRILLQAAVNHKDTSKALWSLQHLNELDESVSMDAVTFNTLLTGVINKEGVEAGYDVYEEFCVRGEVPAGMVVCRTLLTAAIRADKPYIQNAMKTVMERARRSR